MPDEPDRPRPATLDEITEAIVSDAVIGHKRSGMTTLRGKARSRNVSRGKISRLTALPSLVVTSRAHAAAEKI
jgi:hypothetical protein